MSEEKGDKSMADKKVLTEEELLDVLGGYIFFDTYGNHKYQLIDDTTGDVRYESTCRNRIEYYAKKYGYSTEKIDWNKLDKLRKEYQAKKNQQ
jgi:hypothetical protein